MSKSKNTPASEMTAGAESLKSGFEKSAKLFEATTGFNKCNIEAYVQSATIASEGFRTISTEISLYSRKSMEETVSATREIMNSKSTHEALELQIGFARMAFGAYFGQLKILNGLFVDTMKEAMGPVQSRFEVLSERAASATAA